MQPIEIIVIILTVAFLVSLIGRYIYKKYHHLPTGECSCCSHTDKSKLVKQFRKKYPKK